MKIEEEDVAPLNQCTMSCNETILIPLKHDKERKLEQYRERQNRIQTYLNLHKYLKPPQAPPTPPAVPISYPPLMRHCDVRDAKNFNSIIDTAIEDHYLREYPPKTVARKDSYILVAVSDSTLDESTPLIPTSAILVTGKGVTKAKEILTRVTFIETRPREFQSGLVSRDPSYCPVDLDVS